ncbi:MAG: polysaccharide biosynthesis C-terminal domain-containing protein, partial [Acidimicrobiales bacterium]
MAAFGLAIVVAREFGAVGSGVFFEAVALFTIASTVAKLGADTGLTRSISRRLVQGRAPELRALGLIATWPPLVVATAAGIGLWVGAPELTHLAFRGEHLASTTEYLRLLAPFLPLATASLVLLPGTRGFQAIWPLVGIQNMAMPILRIVLLPILLLAGLGTLSVALAWALPLALGAAVGVMSFAHLSSSARRAAPETAPSPVTREAFWSFWRFAAPSGLVASCNIIILWLDVLLVGALVSTAQSGIYAVASRCISIATYSVGALGFAIAPQFSRLYASGRLREAGRVFRTATAWLMAVAWPVCLVMGVFAPVVLRLFGREFVSGAVALSILAPGMLVATGTGNCSIVLLMTGRSSAALAIAAGSMAVNIGLDLALIPRLGIVGAAIGWAVTMVISNGSTTLLLLRLHRLHPISYAFVFVALDSILCYGVLGLMLRLWVGPTVPALTASVVVGSLLYVAALWSR